MHGHATADFAQRIVLDYSLRQNQSDRCVSSFRRDRITLDLASGRYTQPTSSMIAVKYIGTAQFMKTFPIFLSVVLVVRNQSSQLGEMLHGASNCISALVSDHEIIVVDNASHDDSLSVLRQFTGEGGLPNVQVYALTKEVDPDIATWVGMENALGDFVAVVDPLADDIGFLREMLESAASGADVVFARNDAKPDDGWIGRFANATFDRIYQYFNGIRLTREAPPFRVLSKRVINYILQHPQPATLYRHLPASGGFARVNLEYRWPPAAATWRPLGERLDLGMRLIVSTTRAPMRWVASLSLFGAAANVVYSLYVVAIGLFKSDVAPGWVSLSLQQSGMFFLISLVLFVLGEYILNITRLSNEGPLYHVAQEFTSVSMSRLQKLNVEESALRSSEPTGVHSGRGAS